MNECDIAYPPVEGDDEEESGVPVGVELRPMEPADLEEVKRLHEQCFPVRYDMMFYENVVRGVLARGKGEEPEPLYTQVALSPPDKSWSHLESEVKALPNGVMNKDAGGHEPRHSGMNVQDGREEADVLWSANHREDRIENFTSAVEGQDRENVSARRGTLRIPRGKIVGLITCQVMPLQRCRDRDRLGVQSPFGRRHSDVVYILTLGTDTSYRRRGIGRALLRNCLSLARQEESIGAVYLHVITTNPAAHRFYESEGFVQLCCIRDYYKIDGDMYDCFLYALFVNGAQYSGHWDWSVHGLTRRLRSIVDFLLRTIGHFSDDDKLAATGAAADVPPFDGQAHRGSRAEVDEADMNEPRGHVREHSTASAPFAAAAGAAVAASCASYEGPGSQQYDETSRPSATTVGRTRALDEGRGFAISGRPMTDPCSNRDNGREMENFVQGRGVQNTSSVCRHRADGERSAHEKVLWNAANSGGGVAWVKAQPPQLSLNMPEVIEINERDSVIDLAPDNAGIKDADIRDEIAVDIV